MATPPTFSAGAVLTATQMNAVGLWLIKTQTIGTGVTSISVTDVFSSDYDNYLITISGGAASTQNLLRLKMGTTATGYYYTLQYVAYNSTPLAVSGSNSTFVDYAGAGTSNGLRMFCEVLSPNLTKNTGFFARTANSTTWAGSVSGILDNTTSYTGCTIEVSTGTVTGGTIRVYGYRN